MAYGRDGYREIVERNCLLATKLGAAITAAGLFTLLAPIRMNVVCFSPRIENASMDLIRDFLSLVRDDGRAFFTPTLYQGTPAIRAAISNWQTEESDIEIAAQALNELMQKYVKNNSLVHT